MAPSTLVYLNHTIPNGNTDFNHGSLARPAKVAPVGHGVLNRVASRDYFHYNSDLAVVERVASNHLKLPGQQTLYGGGASPLALGHW
jgi:hypothetical protein